MEKRVSLYRRWRLYTLFPSVKLECTEKKKENLFFFYVPCTIAPLPKEVNIVLKTFASIYVQETPSP